MVALDRIAAPSKQIIPCKKVNPTGATRTRVKLWIGHVFRGVVNVGEIKAVGEYGVSQDLLASNQICAQTVNVKRKMNRTRKLTAWWTRSATGRTRKTRHTPPRILLRLQTVLSRCHPHPSPPGSQVFGSLARCTFSRLPNRSDTNTPDIRNRPP